MNTNLILIIFLIFAIVLIMVFKPRDNSFHRNISAGLAKTVLLLAVITALFCIFFLGKDIYRNGLGALETDYDTQKERADETGDEGEAAEGTSDMLIITVSLDRMSDGSISTRDPEDLREQIGSAANGGHTIRIIDDYALESTYTELMSLVRELAADRVKIEEVRR